MMKDLRAYFSTFLSMVILVASLLPALHSLNHEVDTKNNDALAEFTQASVECEVCDFHIDNSDSHLLFAYHIYMAQKETAYTISLAETVNLFPHPLYSLRAPPVVIA